MSDHRIAVYNNSCLKVPRHPLNQQPFPVYEQEYLQKLNFPRKSALDIKNMDIKFRSSYSPDSQKVILKSLLEFYDSIPEYDDVNHLPNKEFYKKLENLKEKQRLFYKYFQNGIKYEGKKTEWTDDYKRLAIGEKKISETGNAVKRPKSSLKSYCTTPLSIKKNSDVESLSSFEKEVSKRNVRIDESADDKSSPTAEEFDELGQKIKTPCTSRAKDKNSLEYYWDDLSIKDYRTDSEKDILTTKSAPASPVRNKLSVAWKDNGVTIPRPFQMTVRDEENQIIEEIVSKEKERDTPEEKHEMFRAHPVPLESRIPLFDKIMAEQERRREKVKSRSKQALLAQMRPFSFTRREEELREIGKYVLSKSSPSIFSTDKPKKYKPFKAKPVPKNLFSNYIYKKMNEDEFYRSLQKKIRAEEMLKASSLPPSMAKREKTKQKFDICPKTLKSLNELRDSDICKKCLHFIPHHKKECLEKELKELAEEFMENQATPSPKHTKKRTRKGSKKGSRSSTSSSRNASAQSYISDSLRPKSAAELQSVNRSNLAAVLRIESAKKRLQEEMMRRLEEAKLRDEIRWREKALRQKPVWQSLAYSHEEDLAMRLQLRRDEERMRNEEHRHRMEMMYGRVNDMPTLFERQSQFTKYSKPKQHCLSKYEKNFNKILDQRCSSQLSDLFDRTSRQKMVDEAIQAKVEEFSEDSSSIIMSKESHSNKKSNNEQEKTETE